MRKITITVFALIFLIPVLSQAAVVKGRIKNGEPGMLVRIYYYTTDFEGKEISDEVNVGKDTSFTLQLNLGRPDIVNLEVADNHTVLFLRQQDTLNVSVDINDFDGLLNYSGTNAHDNNYLADEIRNKFSVHFINPAMFTDTSIFRQFMDTIEKANRYFYASFDSTKFTSEFKQYMSTELKYRYWDMRYIFSFEYNIVIHNYQRRKLPTDYFNYLRKLDFNDQAAAEYGSYQIALVRYRETFLNDSIKALEKDTANHLLNNQRILNRFINFYESHFKEKVYDYMMTTLLNDNMNILTMDPKFGNKILDAYQKRCKNAEYVSFINAKYKSVFRLNPGETVPEFVLTEPDGRRTAISSFRGKYVLIDFWATWCGPCVVAFPQLQSMITDPRFKNVQIVFVNNRDDENAWRGFLEKNGSKGTQLFADNKETMTLQQQFEIDGIPRSILVDRKGKIIDAFFIWKTPEDILKALKPE